MLSFGHLFVEPVGMKNWAVIYPYHWIVTNALLNKWYFTFYLALEIDFRPNSKYSSYETVINFQNL